MNLFISFINSFLFIGDTGSPLMIYSNHSAQYELVGITSVRNSCTNAGIFTRVAPFINWISTTLANPPTIIPIFPTFPTATVPTPKPDVLGKVHRFSKNFHRCS